MVKSKKNLTKLESISLQLILLACSQEKMLKWHLVRRIDRSNFFGNEPNFYGQPDRVCTRKFIAWTSSTTDGRQIGTGESKRTNSVQMLVALSLNSEKSMIVAARECLSNRRNGSINNINTFRWSHFQKCQYLISMKRINKQMSFQNSQAIIPLIIQWVFFSDGKHNFCINELFIAIFCVDVFHIEMHYCDQSKLLVVAVADCIVIIQSSSNRTNWFYIRYKFTSSNP